MWGSPGRLGVCAIVVALAWPGASAARAATAGGGGTFSLLSTDSVPAGAHTTVEFSYTAPAQPASPVRFFLQTVIVTVTVPSGWTETGPATVNCLNSAACDVTSDSGAQIVVWMNLEEEQTFTLDYPATAPGSAGTFPFGATGAFNGSTTMIPLTAQKVTVTCLDGTGTMTVDPGSMSAGQSTDLKFTYTAGSCGVETGGEVAVTVPSEWPAPTPASVTWSGSAAPEVTGWTITVLVGSVGPEESVIFYDNMARAPTYLGGYTFDAFEQSSTIGSLQALAMSPQVTVTPVVAATSPPVSVPPSSPSPTISPSGPASSGTVSPSVPVHGAGTIPPASGSRLPIALVASGVGAGSLVLLAGTVGLLAFRARRSRRRDGRPRRGAHGTGGGNVRVVPHAGPPSSVAVRDTGTRPALTVRLEPRAYTTMTTIKEQRP